MKNNEVAVCPVCDEKPFQPNAETVAAMEEARAGKLKFSTLETLIEDLNSDD